MFTAGNQWPNKKHNNFLSEMHVRYVTHTLDLQASKYCYTHTHTHTHSHSHTQEQATTMPNDKAISPAVFSFVLLIVCTT